MFDEEQHVELAEPDGVDDEGVTGDDPAGRGEHRRWGDDEPGPDPSGDHPGKPRDHAGLPRGPVTSDLWCREALPVEDVELAKLDPVRGRRRLSVGSGKVP